MSSIRGEDPWRAKTTKATELNDQRRRSLRRLRTVVSDDLRQSDSFDSLRGLVVSTCRTPLTLDIDQETTKTWTVKCCLSEHCDDYIRPTAIQPHRLCKTLRVRQNEENNTRHWSTVARMPATRPAKYDTAYDPVCDRISHDAKDSASQRNRATPRHRPAESPSAVPVT